MKISSKSGFTMAEIVLVSVILAVGFSSIIMAMNNGLGFVQKTRQKIISINLVREGMEAVYQIRDTNWRRWSGKKDQCRLKIDPLYDNPAGCENDAWMGSGNYQLLTVITPSPSDQAYFMLSGGNIPKLDVTDKILDATDKVYSLCEMNGKWETCPGSDPTSTEGVFLRTIEGKGLFLKNSIEIGGQYVDCANGSDGGGVCGDTSAKEYRFCSRVAYIGKGIGDTEMCGILTNFIED